MTNTASEVVNVVILGTHRWHHHQFTKAGTYRANIELTYVCLQGSI